MAYSRRLELETIKKMIMIYCRAAHGEKKSELCDECSELLAYAEQRMDKCVYGEDKPVCSQCPIHCYKPIMREAVREVMCYSGPRMLRYSPVLVARYMFRKRFKPPPDRFQE